MKYFNIFNIRLLIVIMLGLSACGRQQDPDTLILANSADIRGFDPALATDFRTGQTMSLVYDNLVRFNTGTELVPAIAKRWSIDETGTVYTFHLISNARFHAGDPVTAQDVVYSFERVLDPETGSPQSWLFDRIDGVREFMDGNRDHVAGLIAENDTTLRIHISEPFAPFLQYLAMPSASIVNRRQVETIQTDPAGSGPWRLDFWERDGELSLLRNDDYWGEKPKLSRLRIRLLTEALTRTAEFEAGNLDILGIPDMELDKWRSQPQWATRIQTSDELDLWYVGMNCSRPPFDDIRIRKAMNVALDRKKILSLLLANTGVLAAGPVPPALREDDPDPIPYDPERALQLLQEAGKPDGFSTQLWVAGGSEMFHVLEAMQADWNAVGIKVELLRSDWNVFKTAVREGKPELYYLSWFADYPDGENFLYPLFHSSESMVKRNRFSDPEIDHLIETVQQLPDSSRRDSLIALTNRQLMEKVPMVFLWHSQTNTLTQPWISGYESKMIFNAERYLTVRKHADRLAP